MIALQALSTPAAARCASCSHFDNSAAAVEAALPGLRSFGSAQSAVRTADGVCARTGRYLDAARSCGQHVERASPAP
jgi:hypothetical protein